MLELKRSCDEEVDGRSSFGNKLMLVLIFVLLIILVLTQFYRISEVSGWSMRNTIHDGDLVIVTTADKIRKGDIVTARAPTVNIIKRVVGVGGDRMVFALQEDGTVELYIDEGNGFFLADEPFIYRRIMTERGFESQEKFERREYKLYSGDIADVTDDYIITVGEGQFFLMGDNRDESRDSRHYGLFDKDNIFGKVVRRYEEGTPMYKFLDFFYNLKLDLQKDNI